MPETHQNRTNLNNPFIALKHRGFSFFLAGMTVSMIGTWMQNIAQPWLVYSLTQSPLLLSLVGALQFMPVLLFSLFAGVIADKFSKKKILIVTQSASMLITLLLAILVLSGQVRFWHIIITATAMGFVNALDMPTRQSFVSELVPKEDLMNAIALNSTVFNLSRIIGPAIAGIIMATSGAAMCFFINAFSFGGVLVSLIFIIPNGLPFKQPVGRRILDEVKEGLRYIRRTPALFETLLAIAIIGTFVPNFGVLVPVFAKEILKQSETGFGILMSSIGVGSLIGAFFIASVSRSGPKRYMLTVIPFAVGGFMALTGYTSTFIMTALLLALTGLFFLVFQSSANSTLQLNSSAEYRGRVMSAYSLVFAGSTPIGNLYAGIFTEKGSARAGFVACGSAVLILMVPLLLFMKRNDTSVGR